MILGGSKPTPEAIIEFGKWCESVVRDGGRTLGALDFDEWLRELDDFADTDSDDGLVDYGALNYDVPEHQADFHALSSAVADKFVIEEHGYDEFYIKRQRGRFRVRRVSDGRFYKGPMHENVFAASGKRFKTREGAQATIDAFADFKAFDNGQLEIVDDEPS